MAGGMANGSRFKLALVGGAAGAIVGPDSLDVPLDYSSGNKGVPMGSGGVLFCDESNEGARKLYETLGYQTVFYNRSYLLRQLGDGP